MSTNNTGTTTVKKYNKKYRCPYCDYKFEREKLVGHVDKYHEDLIPEGYTAGRVAFNAINKKDHGTCIICKKESPWNEDKQRYERLCGSKKCHDEYLKICEERMKKKYNGKTKEDMLNDPEFQDKMLKGRSISGEYKFENGVSIPYVGSYERNFLEFMDKYLHVLPEDIQAPGPTIEYMYNGKKHFWITDFYYIPYNLVLDIKDGGNNPNTRNMEEYREKQVEKERAISKYKKFNYLRLTNNQFDQLLEVMLELKESMLDLDIKQEKVDPLIKINESSINGNEYKNSAELIINECLNNPYTYINNDISPIENVYYNMTVKEADTHLSLLEAAIYDLDVVNEEDYNGKSEVLESMKSLFLSIISLDPNSDENVLDKIYEKEYI